MLHKVELKHEYHFDSTEHFIETDFVKDENEVEHHIINTPTCQGDFIKYQNGLCILVNTDIQKGQVSYFTNYPLKEISPNRFTFDFS